MIFRRQRLGPESLLVDAGVPQRRVHVYSYRPVHLSIQRARSSRLVPGKLQDLLQTVLKHRNERCDRRPQSWSK